jgi:hypothetical protein
MSRHSLRPAGELLVSYSAEQMPTPAIAEIQAKTVSDLNAGQIALVDALKIFNLLLTITLQKLKAAS